MFQRADENPLHNHDIFIKFMLQLLFGTFGTVVIPVLLFCYINWEISFIIKENGRIRKRKAIVHARSL